MKKFIIFIFYFIACNDTLKSQAITYGFGLELNQTRFRQYAPTINVPFENPHLPGLGLTTFYVINCTINKFMSFHISPLIGLYNTRSNVTEDYYMKIYGLRLGSSYKFRKFRTEFGLEYNRLHSMLGTTTKGTTRDWTFFAHRRDLFGPTISLGYKINPLFAFNCRSTYFLHDFYSSGALDFDGNIVGPVEVTPFILAVGVDFRFNNSELEKWRNKGKSRQGR